MATRFEFIIDGIFKVGETDRIEGLERGKTVTIRGTKKGFLKNEEILISIERSQRDPEKAALVSANINDHSQSEHILKEILYDILTKTEMLDAKLKMKLDIVLNERKMRYVDGKLILE